MKQLGEMTLSEMSEVYNWTWSRYRLASDGYERFGLTKGDVLVCVGAWYDYEKLIVLFREHDQFKPGISAYRTDTETLGNYRGSRS